MKVYDIDASKKRPSSIMKGSYDLWITNCSSASYDMGGFVCSIIGEQLYELSHKM